MKTLIKSLMVFFLGLQISCSPKTIPYSADVNFINREQSGTILVKSTGNGKNLNSAVYDAQINAFMVILFKGLPGTELNLPLIENETEARSKNKDYFDKFFNQGRFQNFMMASTISSDLIKSRENKTISVDIKINYNSLRKDLEQNNIIRKFGY